MKRLTKRDEYGNADIIGVDSADLQLNLDYESMNKVTKALNRLAYDADEALKTQIERIEKVSRKIKESQD